MIAFNCYTSLHRYVNSGWTTIKVEYADQSALIEVTPRNFALEIVKVLKDFGRQFDSVLNIHKFCKGLDIDEQFALLRNETLKMRNETVEEAL